MSLRTGKRLHGFIWNEVPITDEVISRVEQLGEEDGQPMIMDEPIFEWAPGYIVEDNIEQQASEIMQPQAASISESEVLEDREEYNDEENDEDA